MAERPILFSGPMVRAILAGTKTQTRRVVPGVVASGAGGLLWPEPGGGLSPGGRVGGVYDQLVLDNSAGHASTVERCPFGVPGDRLWVRETWKAHRLWDGCPPSEMLNDGKACIRYEADGAVIGGCSDDRFGARRSSIHMPRWASRLTLEVVEVRVQRVQEISEEDARAEGIEPYRPSEGDGGATEGPAWNRIQFSHLWDSINGKRAPWASNPWVWAIAFKRVDAEAAP